MRRAEKGREPRTPDVRFVPTTIGKAVISDVPPQTVIGRVLAAAVSGGASDAEVFLVGQLLDVLMQGFGILNREMKHAAPIVQKNAERAERPHDWNRREMRKKSKSGRVYVSRPVTPAEKAEAEKLNNQLRRQFPKAAARYREIAKRKNCSDSRVRYMVEGQRRKKK